MNSVIFKPATLIVLLLAFSAGSCGKQSAQPSADAVAPPTSKPADKPVLGFAWPADAERLAGVVTLQFAEGQPGQMRVVAINLKQPCTLRVPRGTRLIPVENTLLTGYITWKDVELVLNPETVEGQRIGLNVVMTDIEKWATGRDKDRWELATDIETADDRLIRFFKVAEESKDLAWSQVQIGASAILQNIPVKALYGKHMKISSGMVAAMAPDLATEYRIYSYRAVKRVELLFAQIGEPASRYTLFADNEANFAKELKTHSVPDWSTKLSIGYSGNLFSGLDDYSAEPQTRDLLLAYARRHTDYYHASQAAKYIVESKCLGADTEVLYRMAGTDPDRLVRYAAARTLMAHNDWRGLPLITVYGQDHELVGSFANDLIRHLSQEAGIQPDFNKTLGEVWNVTDGWTRLARVHGDVSVLKNSVANLLAKEEETVTRLIATVAPTGKDGVFEALRAWPSRYPWHRAVLNWVYQVIRSNPDAQARVAAIKELHEFKTFNHFEVLMDRLDNDANSDVRIAAVSADWSTDPHQRATFFGRAVRNPSAPVRQRAISGLDEKAVDETVTRALIEVVRTDSLVELRIDAIKKLTQFKPSASLDVVRESVGITDKKFERLAVESLRSWTRLKLDAEGLALVKHVAATHPLPVMRAVAVSELGDYHKHKFAVMDVALDRVAHDADSNVQVNAVILAHRLMDKSVGLEKEQAAQVVERALASSHATPRTYAAKAVGDLKLKTMEPSLATMARQEKDEEARLAAYDALRQLEAASRFDVLVQWLKSVDPKARRVAVKYLARDFPGDARTRPLLEPCRQDADFTVKRDVVKFLDAP